MRAFWILGDQLLSHHPSLRLAADEDTFIFIESLARGNHLRYHQHKLVLLYSAMRHYAEDLKKSGRTVWYHKLGDGQGDYLSALTFFVKKEKPSSIHVMEPNEWEMQEILPKLSKKINVSIELLSNEQFLVSREEFKQWSRNKKTFLMASHYQHQRQQMNILLDEDGKPEGGSWSFDSENRSSAADFLKTKKKPVALPAVKHDKITLEVIADVKKHWSNHLGAAETFWLPVTRAEALLWLDHFINHNLNDFGPFEDAMISGQKTLYHSVLSPVLNIGLISPQECVEAALLAYKNNKAPLASVEGFIRQIIGWREFINGIYWLKMPEYKDHNFLNAQRPLPKWIYDGETDLNCLRQSIQQAAATGYNHHIQRLMVLGNFFILSGCEPKAVLRWYMEMYVDAYDWVMQPNVIGMILYADGGLFATKPYVAGSGYISRMSNYCAGCRYKPEIKVGPQACPFNYLYWNFFDQHAEVLKKNPRIGMMLRTWAKKDEVEKEKVRQSAQTFLKSLS